MKMLMQDFSEKFRTIIGDEAHNVPDNLIIEVFNAALQKATSVPGLSRAFRKHYRVELNAKDGYKWKLEGDFRRVSDIKMLNLYTTGQGGDPCRLPICQLNSVAFYNKNGIPSLKKAGIPCEYTIEQEDDDTWLVLDRPSDVPLVLDYIVEGYPTPIETMQDEIEISAVIEELIKDSMTAAFYKEAEDLAFAGATLDIMSNVYEPQAIQMLNKNLGIEEPTIIGEP